MDKRNIYFVVKVQSLVLSERHLTSLFVRIILWDVLVFLNWGTVAFHGSCIHRIFSSSKALSGFHCPVYMKSVLEIQPLNTYFKS